MICPVCETRVNKPESIIDFNVIGYPIPDRDLRDIKGGLLTVMFANGPESLGGFIRKSERVELIQNQCKYFLKYICENDYLSIIVQLNLESTKVTSIEEEKREREEAFTAERLKVQHHIQTLEAKVEQLESNMHEQSSNIKTLNDAIADRTRQIANWKSMYENAVDTKSSSVWTKPNTSPSTNFRSSYKSPLTKPPPTEYYEPSTTPELNRFDPRNFNGSKFIQSLPPPSPGPRLPHGMFLSRPSSRQHKRPNSGSINLAGGFQISKPNQLSLHGIRR